MSETVTDQYLMWVARQLTPGQRALVERLWLGDLLWDGLSAGEQQAIEGCAAFAVEGQTIDLPGGARQEVQVVTLTPLGQAVVGSGAWGTAGQ